MPKIKDLTNMRFGKWLILESDIIKNGKRYCKCKCECGEEHLIDKRSLTCGKSTQCHKCASTKHGGSETRLYSIWKNMKQRCSNPKASKYNIYGGKGISVCKQWLNFKNFEKWALNNGYNDVLSIDRIDNNKNYCPENCRWVTYKQQANNTSQNHLITYQGQTKDIAQWAEDKGLSYKVLSERIRRKWDINRALNTSAVNGGI